MCWDWGDKENTQALQKGDLADVVRRDRELFSFEISEKEVACERRVNFLEASKSPNASSALRMMLSSQ